jgi:cytochrome c-type biogenesis protein CcmH
MFYLLIVVFSVVVIGMMIPAFLNRRAILVDNPEAQNALIARQRIEEAQSQLSPGESVSGIELEIQSALIDDIKKQHTTPTGKISPFLSLGVSLVIPVMGLLIYYYLGSPESIPVTPGAPTTTQPIDDSSQDVASLLAQLEERIAQEPTNSKGWELAARTYMSLTNYPKAEHAYRQLNALVPGNPDFLSSWADASIMANGNAYTDDARKAVTAALKLDPQHVNALWIAALGSGSTGEYESANVYLNRLLPLVGSNEELISNINRLINTNNRKQSESGEIITATQANPGKEIKVKVNIDRTAVETLEQFKAVYIIARAQNGAPAPLAVSKHLPSELPVSITLTRSMSMIPGMDIDSVEELEIVARLSLSGNPVAGPGDYESQSKPVSAYNIGALFNLTIDQLIDKK